VVTTFVTPGCGYISLVIDPVDSPTARRDRYVVALVENALDDLAEHRVDVPAALRLVAHHAWADGRQAGLDPDPRALTRNLPP
jgi:hypothetical protein